MKILILGYSNIVKRRVLNVLIKRKVSYSVASKSKNKRDKNAYEWFNNYDHALKKSNADLVYISLPNSLHYYWAKKALQRKFHVIVDKPIVRKKNQLIELISIAKKNKKLLSESIFFNYHKQFKQALKLCGGINKINHTHANFIIPTPSIDSLLMSKFFCGGALMDMGPYAAAITRLIFKNKPNNFYSFVEKNKKGLPISFNVLCNIKNKTFSGNFCFGGQYKSNLTFYTNDKTIEINRAFAPPSDTKLKILVEKNNLTKTYIVNKDNAFDNYFLKIIKAISSNNYNYFINSIKYDVDIRKKISV